jgi:hypothetical protein
MLVTAMVFVAVSRRYRGQVYLHAEQTG